MEGWTRGSDSSPVPGGAALFSCRQAKLDSMALLAAAAMRYGHGGDGFSHEQVATVWAALRTELAAPAANDLLAERAPGTEEVADAAQACLATFIQQVGPEGRGAGT